MKKQILYFFYIITYPFAIVFSEKVVKKLLNVRNNFYSSFLRHRFGRCGKLNIAGLPIHLHGAKYMELGDNVEFGCHCRVCAIDHFQTGQIFTPHLVIGNNVVIQTLCHIGCINKIVIGDYTTMGARVYITDHTHGDTTKEHLLLPPRWRPLVSRGPVIIGRNVHIGENSCIMPGVTIGDYCVIGANSVVTRDVPKGCIAAGVPAKVIRTIDFENN